MDKDGSSDEKLDLIKRDVAQLVADFPPESRERFFSGVLVGSFQTIYAGLSHDLDMSHEAVSRHCLPLLKDIFNEVRLSGVPDLSIIHVLSTFAALAELTETRKECSANDIIALFHTLLTTERRARSESSVGINAQFVTDNARNKGVFPIRFGIFNEVEKWDAALDLVHRLACMRTESCVSTLHLDFNLTEAQCLNYIRQDNPMNEHNEVYDRIVEKLVCLSSSAVRNTPLHRVEIGVLHMNEKQNLNLEPWQTARLCYSNFGLEQDGDFQMVKLAVHALWQALDDPARAETLNRHLDSIFTKANIFDPEERVIRTQGEEFDLCAPEGQLAARRVSYRPLVREYLQGFVEGREQASFTQVLQSIHEPEAAQSLLDRILQGPGSFGRG